MSGSPVSPPPPMARTSTIPAGRVPPRRGWRRRSGDWRAPSPDRRTVADGGKRSRHGTARSPIAASDFHHKTAGNLVEPYEMIVVEDLGSPTCCAGPNPCPTPITPGSSCPTEPPRSPGLTEVLVTRAGVSSSRFCAPKRKTLGALWIEVDPGTPPTAASPVGMPPERTASAKRNFVCQRCGHTAQADEHAARNILRAGLALYAAHLREKKLMASAVREVTTPE